MTFRRRVPVAADNEVNDEVWVYASDAEVKLVPKATVRLHVGVKSSWDIVVLQVMTANPYMLFYERFDGPGKAAPVVADVHGID